MKLASHSIESHNHGSPPSFVELGRAVLGGFDLDPCSSPRWNANVRAARIITAEEDGLETPWFDGAPAPNRLLTDRRAAPPGHTGRVWINSPNDRRGKLVAGFWVALVEYYLRRWVTSAIWCGFNVEQLSRLQRVGARSSPLKHPTIVPRSRENYLDGVTGQLQEDAPHASYLTLLSRNPREIQTFAALGHELGDVINGDRY